MDYRPTLTNFKPLYSSLLVYKQNFQKLYDFLADGIKSEYIPRADNKDGGLIKIFIDKILDLILLTCLVLSLTSSSQTL